MGDGFQIHTLIILLFILCTLFESQRYLNEKSAKKNLIIFTPSSSVCSIFRPQITITDAFAQLPGWVPAPIPISTPPPQHTYISFGENITTCTQRFIASTPEEPTMRNVLHKAVVFFGGGIITQKIIYLPTDHLILDLPSKTANISKMRVFQHAIPFFHRYHNNYNHFLIETFPNLLAHGRELIEKCVILHGPMMKPLFKELVIVFDLKFVRTYTVRAPVLVENLYITNPHKFLDNNPNAVRYMRSYLLKKFGYDKLNATKYVTANRPKNRIISNFAEMLEALKTNFPQIRFEQPDYYDFLGQAKFWRQVKLAMCAHGAILTNLVWMHQNTVLIEFNVRDCRNGILRFARSLGIYPLEVMFPKQERLTSMVVEMPMMIEMVKRGLEILEKADLCNF